MELMDDPAYEWDCAVCQDVWFDCLNVSSLSEGRRSLKKDLYPYRTSSDTQFDVSALIHVQQWGTTIIYYAISTLSGLKRSFLVTWMNGSNLLMEEDNWLKASRTSCALVERPLKDVRYMYIVCSNATHTLYSYTLYTTVHYTLVFVPSSEDIHSTICWVYLVSACYWVSDLPNIPWSPFFGYQSQRGGGRDNPTVQQFMQATQSIRVQHSTRPLAGSNVRTSKLHTQDEQDLDIPAPKRRKHSHSRKWLTPLSN